MKYPKPDSIFPQNSTFVDLDFCGNHNILVVIVIQNYAVLSKNLVGERKEKKKCKFPPVAKKCQKLIITFTFFDNKINVVNYSAYFVPFLFTLKLQMHSIYEMHQMRYVGVIC